MYRILDKRGSGKTMRLMEVAHDEGATIVCAYPNNFRQKAQYYGYNNLDFIDYYTYLHGTGINNKTKYLIDEPEFLVRELPGTVIGYCQTIE